MNMRTLVLITLLSCLRALSSSAQDADTSDNMGASLPVSLNPFRPMLISGIMAHGDRQTGTVTLVFNVTNTTPGPVQVSFSRDHARSLALDDSDSSYFVQQVRFGNVVQDTTSLVSAVLQYDQRLHCAFYFPDVPIGTEYLRKGGILCSMLINNAKTDGTILFSNLKIQWRN